MILIFEWSMGRSVLTHITDSIFTPPTGPIASTRVGRWVPVDTELESSTVAIGVRLSEVLSERPIDNLRT